MSKGIVRVANAYNNSEIVIVATESIEDTFRDFESGILPFKTRPNKTNRVKVKLEVLEETDDLALRYAFYTWPQIERVKYSELCMSLSLNRSFSQRVKKSVDWLVGMYIDRKYTFEMTVVESELIAIVFEEGRPIEKYYRFKKSGEPMVREFLENDHLG